MKRRTIAAVTVVLAIAGGVAGCGETVTTSTGTPPPPPRRAGAFASASASSSASAAPIAYGEADFTPSDRNRDPFRNYVELFVSDASDKSIKNQQKVVADRFALDELKLVAIVTGGTNARAMFVDPDGKGWIVLLGQLVGRSELVRAGGAGGAEYDLNWRVDRIREGDVVFVRENPGRANVPTATRVVALRPEGDQNTRRRLEAKRRSTQSVAPPPRCSRARPRRAVTSPFSLFSTHTTWPRCRSAAYDRERVRRDRA